jgi:hypothetical protein
VIDESTKDAAQEYLAARLSEDGLTHEQRLKRDASIALAPVVWKSVSSGTRSHRKILWRVNPG